MHLKSKIEENREGNFEEIMAEKIFQNFMIKC